MQRHDPNIKSLPDAQEQGTQDHPTNHYYEYLTTDQRKPVDHRWRNLAEGLTGGEHP